MLITLNKGQKIKPGSEISTVAMQFGLYTRVLIKWLDIVATN